MRRGCEPIQGNGIAGKERAYITVNDVPHRIGVSSTRQRRVTCGAIEGEQDYNGDQRAATPHRGREPIRGNDVCLFAQADNREGA